MNRFVLYHAVLAAALPLAIAVKPVAAQFTQSGNAYYVTGDYTLAYDVSGNDVYVGKDTAFNTLPGTATFTVAPGANVTFFNTYTNGSTAFYSLNTFGSYRTNVTGGNVTLAEGLDTSITTITGGTVNLTTGFGVSTMNISGGTVYNASLAGNSTMNISGGTVQQAISNSNGTTTISGGTVTSGLALIRPLSKVLYTLRDVVC